MKERGEEMKKKHKVIQMLGGATLLYILAVLFIGGATLLLFKNLTFLIEPVVKVFQVVLPPLTMTLVLYFVLKPVVKFLVGLGLSKVLSIIITLCTLTAAFILSTALALPLLIQQFERLIENFPNYLIEAERVIETFIQNTRYEQAYHEGLEVLANWINQVSNNVGVYLGNIIFGASQVFSTITHVLLLLLTVPIITFFLLKNDRQFVEYSLGIFPPRLRHEVKEIIRTMENQVGAYLKGQLVVCVIIGTLTFIGFLIIDMPFSGSLAFLVGATAIVPYIGPVVAFFPCAIIAIMTSPTMFIQLCIVWIVVQLLNGELIEPQVMGKHMVIHPVTIIFVLWIMGELFGMFGLIFGIPFYAIVKVLVVFGFRKFKQRYNRIYAEDVPYEETEFSLESYTKKSSHG
ncbi:AI-2E family transporter [Enterococcus sp. AZ040]|uniref:AI-2E family transporter n=1 Tax=Enterococcus sp. AZ040 TaxID=2774855 RepID=UPI003D295CB5